MVVAALRPKNSMSFLRVSVGGRYCQRNVEEETVRVTVSALALALAVADEVTAPLLALRLAVDHAGSTSNNTRLQLLPSFRPRFGKRWHIMDEAVVFLIVGSPITCGRSCEHGWQLTPREDR